MGPYISDEEPKWGQEASWPAARQWNHWSQSEICSPSRTPCSLFCPHPAVSASSFPNTWAKVPGRETSKYPFKNEQLHLEKKNPFLLNHLENESWLWTVTDFSNFKCELRHLPTRTHRVMNMQREKLNKIHPKKMFCNAISITKTAFSPLHSSSRT